MSPGRESTLPSRKLELDSLATRISGLEDKRQHLVRELAETDAQLRIERANYNNLCNEELPVSKLPVELLSSIFLLGQKTAGAKHRHSFNVTVSHVCGRWRATALSTPLLWNTIRLVKPTYNRSKLEAHLIRSDGCLLDISVKMSSSTVHTIMNTLIHHSKRWRRFSLRAIDDVSSVLSEYLHEASAPLLEYLYLDVGDHLDPDDPTPFGPSCPKIFIQGTPALRAVHLSGVAQANLRPNLSNITTLELDVPFVLQTDTTEIARVLEGLRSLTNLSVSSWEFFPDDSFNATNPVTLPSLRSLRICGLQRPPQLSLLSLLALPSLESLALEELEEFDSPLFPSVKNLYLDWCGGFVERDFRNLFRSCPSVTHLSMSLSETLIYLLLTPSEAKIPWPSLQAMRILYIEDVAIPVFRTMVTKRKSCEHPVKELYLTKYSRNKFRRNTRLRWFEESMVVEICEDVESWAKILGYDPRDVFT